MYNHKIHQMLDEITVGDIVSVFNDGRFDPFHSTVVQVISNEYGRPRFYVTHNEYHLYLVDAGKVALKGRNLLWDKEYFQAEMAAKRQVEQLKEAIAWVMTDSDKSEEEALKSVRALKNEIAQLNRQLVWANMHRNGEDANIGLDTVEDIRANKVPVNA